MTGAVVVAAIVIVLIALAVMSRSTGRRQRAAKEDLKREQEEVGRFDILELVRQELEESGAAEVPGGAGVDPSVLLRVWKRDEEVRSKCADPSSLRFTIDDGTKPAEADDDHVRLTCGESDPPDGPAEEEAQGGDTEEGVDEES